MDAAKRRAEAHLDGRCVIHSNDDSLTPTDLALGDTPRHRVEEAWRTLNSGLRLRPVFHWAAHRLLHPRAGRKPRVTNTAVSSTPAAVIQEGNS